MKIKDVLEIDYLLLLFVIVLTAIGILFVYSSGVSSGQQLSNEYIKQILWAVIGIIVLAVVSFFDYRKMYDWSIYIYLGTLALLLYTVFFGRLVNGARAWIGIGSYGIQPSEFAKVASILLLARYLDSSKHSQNEFKRFFISCMIVFVPMGIILLQPDFGTALVFVPILLVMTTIAGITAKYIAFLGICIGLTGFLMVVPLWQEYILRGEYPFLLIFSNIRFILILITALILISLVSLYGFFRFKRRYFFWLMYASAILIFSFSASFLATKVLKDYQIMRLIVFLDPNVDPRGSGWQIIQSITAIGSGGFFGKGYLEGTQSHYRFLPQQSTDFIFSILSEEFGFIGGIFVFALFLFILLRLIKIIKSTSDLFGSYIIAGISGMICFHFVINVGMTMGIMPITGIPLLFMSYGGSSLLSIMLAIGLCQSIHMRRFDH
jgi:rod shape determining protein RodA